MSRDQVLEKVKKLLALAARAGTEHEAALAADRAQALLTRHKLSMRDAQDFAGGTDAVGETLFHNPGDRKLAAWSYWLMVTVAETTYCELIISPKNNVYWLVGRPSDVAVAHELFEFLLEQVRRLTRGYRPRDMFGEPIEGMELQGKRKAFSIGCASRVVDRLKAAYRARQEAPAASTPGPAPQSSAAAEPEEARPSGEEVRALVVQNKAELKAYMNEHHAKLKGGRKSRARAHFERAQSWHAGREAGERVRLGVERKITQGGE